MGNPSRQTFEKLLKVDKCHEIIEQVASCIWESDGKPGDAPQVPKLEMLQKTTFQPFTEHEQGKNSDLFSLMLVEYIDFNIIENEDDEVVKQRKTGTCYSISVPKKELVIAIEETKDCAITDKKDFVIVNDEDIHGLFKNVFAVMAPVAGKQRVFLTLFANLVNATQDAPETAEVEWTHNLWRELQQTYMNMPHPLTKVIRTWIRKNPPSYEIVRRDKQIAPKFLSKCCSKSTSEKLQTGTLHLQGTENLSGQLPLFQESHEEVTVHALPLEIYQGSKSVRGAPLDERIFINALLACPYGIPEPFNAIRLEPTLQDYVNWLYPNGWHRSNQLPLLQKALYDVHNKRIEYERRSWNIVQVLAMPTKKTKLDDVLPLIIQYPDGVGDNGPLIDVHRMRLYGLESAPKWRAWIRLHYLWDTAKQRNGGYPIYATIPKVKKNDQGFLLDASDNLIYSGKPYKQKGRWCVRKGNAPQKAWHHPNAIHIGSERNPQCDKIPVLTNKNLVALFYDSRTVEKDTFLKRVYQAKKAAEDMENDETIIIERDAIDTRRGIKGWRIIPIYQDKNILAESV